ncbi:MAG: hypothetical protein WCK32_00515 [Chlorobiaceae bacterium]
MSICPMTALGFTHLVSLNGMMPVSHHSTRMERDINAMDKVFAVVVQLWFAISRV